MEGRGAQLLGDRVLRLQHGDGNALAAEQQCRGEPHRTRAGDQNLRLFTHVLAVGTAQGRFGLSPALNDAIRSR
jgi:hypothetical protein